MTKPNKKKQSDKLNPREARAIALLKSGKAKTKREALKKAGYSDSTATDHPETVFGKVRCQSALLDAFKKIGINDTYLAKKHKALIEAKNPKTQYAASGPNHQAMAKGLDMAYKLRGEYAPEKHEMLTESYADRIKRLEAEEANQEK